ncbi:HdeD family acid-resistance protein [Providencia rettgeri]|uniref:MFS transporter n=1 Tax=Providencia rettgeri TaxID=587 RepID=A0AAE3CV38_PRORE|nr:MULTISPECIES: MFS transporter [Providencia]MBW3115933.1 MFS transporter [Providencia rettgeri]MCK9791681.1 MFS transporter [Providencia rettgeri]MDX7423127.1 MFS transporter [Providencia sp. CIM-Carb-044]NHN51350.1 MFS transporter [Providencia rettgeri]
MLQIALLLFGAEFIRGKAHYLWGIGLLWCFIGIFIFIDGIDGILFFPIHLFGFLLLLESLITLSVASSGIGTQKTILFFKGGLFLFCALVILINQTYSNVLLSAMFGFVFFITGLFVVASAWIVRFPGWQLILLWGVIEMLFAFFLFTHHQATISFFIGFLMIGSGFGCLKLAFRARHIQRGTSIFELMRPLPVSFKKKGATRPITENLQSPTLNRSTEQDAILTVHIWTPEGSANQRPVPRPIINRYIAAVDSEGVISTGHASLELYPHLYISLYPEEDIDRSPSEFFRLLKATADNNVPGRFLPNYQAEASEWCESDRQIVFNVYNYASLLSFWEKYRQYPIYNLTYQNCSSSVAYGLEAALDGVLSMQKRSDFIGILNVLCMPELWIAAQIRRRALMMAWTPGLIMDYARALRAIVHPVPVPWYKRLLKR